MDAYWKYQAEKERKLYAIIDAFNQNNGHLNVTDARYINTIKLFISGISLLEYVAHRGFAHAGRAFPGPGRASPDAVARRDPPCPDARCTRSRTTTNTTTGCMTSTMRMTACGSCRCPRAFFDDAITAGPFEFMVSIGFSFEYVLTNLLFVPFVSARLPSTATWAR